MSDFKTKVHDGSHISVNDRFVENGFLALDAYQTDDKRSATMTNIPNASARELAQWILENVPEPEPEPTTAEQMRALEPGTMFTIDIAEGVKFIRLWGDSYAFNSGGCVEVSEISDSGWHNYI